MNSSMGVSTAIPSLFAVFFISFCRNVAANIQQFYEKPHIFKVFSHPLLSDDVWRAAPDKDGNCFCRQVISGDLEADDAGFAVKGFRLVEDEVADAVVDHLALKVLDGL